MKKRRQGLRNLPTEPPLKHIVDKGKYFSVVAELPGVGEENIRICLENDMLTLHWLDPARQHREREISLPCNVRLGSKKFQKGVLEISLEKINN